MGRVAYGTDTSFVRGESGQGQDVTIHISFNTAQRVKDEVNKTLVSAVINQAGTDTMTKVGDTRPGVSTLT